jgi:RNA polymerase sigma-70 factor (ECF subfamily)
VNSAASSGQFAATQWSLVAGAQKPDTPEAAAALEKLCRTYWRPIYLFIRRSSPDEHTAKDLTQGFFERFLEKDYVRDAERARGRFRTFLLTCVKHYLANERDRQRAQRRGGGAGILSIELLLQEGGGEPEANPAHAPDRHYERQWARAVLASAMAKLAADYAAAGRAEVFAALQGHLARDRDEAPYAVVAERLGLSVDAVKKSVERLRRRFGELLRAEIAETVLHPSEIEDELRFLRAALQG